MSRAGAQIAAVGLGGALGTASRYTLSLAALTHAPDWAFLATLAANCLGALLIGWLATRKLVPLSQALWMTGFCGGFTTFSLFSLELLLLVERSVALALAYGGASVVLWLGCVWAGFWSGGGSGREESARSGSPPTRP